MTNHALTTPLPEHPLDVMENLASFHAWNFDRVADNEVSIMVDGEWAKYMVSCTWIDDFEALHIASAFDLKVPSRRQIEILRLVSLVNERLWLGHFDFWKEESVLLFRHTLLLAGGLKPTSQQCEAALFAATDTCERYYQTFQFVIWANRSAKEALDDTAFETVGEA
jgi:hypothetical protein